MKPSLILVSVSSNEAMRPRSEKIEKAVEADDRFSLLNPGEHPFDILFMLSEYSGDRIQKFHVELKDFCEENGSDYLSSIISGHLYEQILAARERQEPVAVVVLGDDNDVGAAIRKAASRANNGHRVDPDKLMEYYRMVEGFEASCIALRVPVWRLKTDPYNRMLLRVRKILEGGDLTGFAPVPAEKERQVVGLSILAGRGIGPVKAGAILEKFRIALVPKNDANFLVDCTGIGEKLAMQLFHSKTISVDCCHVCRPPKPKKGRAKAAKLAEVLG
jgi:hypothetical protein